MADGPLHTAGGGAEALGHLRIKHLGHGVDDIHIVDGNDDGLPQVLVALDVGGDADLVDDGGYLGLQGGGVVLFRLQPARRHNLTQALSHRGDPAGLGHVKIRTLCRGSVHHAALHIAGQDQHPGAALQLGKFLQYIQAVHSAGEYQLHHHRIRLEVTHHVQQLGTVTRFPYHPETRLVIQRPYHTFSKFCSCIGHYDSFYVFHTFLPFLSIFKIFVGRQMFPTVYLRCLSTDRLQFIISCHNLQVIFSYFMVVFITIFDHFSTKF